MGPRGAWGQGSPTLAFMAEHEKRLHAVALNLARRQLMAATASQRASGSKDSRCGLRYESFQPRTGTSGLASAIGLTRRQAPDTSARGLRRPPRGAERTRLRSYPVAVGTHKHRTLSRADVEALASRDTRRRGMARRGVALTPPASLRFQPPLYAETNVCASYTTSCLPSLLDARLSGLGWPAQRTQRAYVLRPGAESFSSA